MPLPDNFSEWEHLQSVMMRVMNKIVRDSFRDDIVDNDINTPESALKYACLLKDDDTAAITAIRMLLLLFVRGELDIFDKLYAVPILNHHRDVTFAPQIALRFKETKESARLYKRSKHPCTLDISFRLTRVEEENITPGQIKQWQAEINTLFPRSFAHTLSQESYSYYDSSVGIKWNLKSQFKTEAIEMFEKIISLMEFIRGHSINNYKKPIRFIPKQMKKHTPEVPYSKEIIKFTGLSETYTIDKNFKGVKVYLHKAQLHLHGRLINKHLVYRPI